MNIPAKLEPDPVLYELVIDDLMPGLTYEIKVIRKMVVIHHM